MRLAMSAVIAEGPYGEPGGLDPTETVLHGQANGATQAAKLIWAGRTIYVVLSMDGEPIQSDGWVLVDWLSEKRKAGGH